MVKFSNQTEWNKQSTVYCERCVNNRTRGDNMGAGCPIDDMRIECSGKQAFKKIASKYLLGDAYDFNQCSMFIDKKSSDRLEK